jgi:hypothetical protein
MDPESTGSSPEREDTDVFEDIPLNSDAQPETGFFGALGEQVSRFFSARAVENSAKELDEFY